MMIIKKKHFKIIIALCFALLCLIWMGSAFAVFAEEADSYIITFDKPVTEEEGAVITDAEVTMLTDKMALVTDSSLSQAALEALNDIAEVQENYVYEFADRGTDGEEGSDLHGTNYVPLQWSLDYMDVPEAWNLIERLKPLGDFRKVKVAVIDTGADYLHKDMAANMDTKHCVRTVNGEIRPYKVSELKGTHGTSTTGIIAGIHNDTGIDGVATGVSNDLISVMAIDVFSNFNCSQGSATTADCVAGINYAVEHGAKVIQMCLGHYPESPDGTGLLHEDAALEAAINDAAAKGCIFVTSAGNRKSEVAWYPSDFTNTISAINIKKYSNAYSKSCKCLFSSYGKKKDVSAPGTYSYTLRKGGKCKTFGGTSAAAPQCAGVVALMCYIDPTLTIRDVRKIFAATCDDLYTEGKDIYTGYGKVNAYRAVAYTAKRLGYTGFPNQIAVDPLEDVQMTVKVKKKKVKISWTEAAQANYYAVYRRTGSSGSFRKIAETEILSYTDKKAPVNRKNYYMVKAFGTTLDGKKTKSAYSNQEMVKIKQVKKAKKVKKTKKKKKKRG